MGYGDENKRLKIQTVLLHTKFSKWAPAIHSYYSNNYDIEHTSIPLLDGTTAALPGTIHYPTRTRSGVLNGINKMVKRDKKKQNKRTNDDQKYLCAIPKIKNERNKHCMVLDLGKK